MIHGVITSGFLEVRGADRLEFVHGQVTNDVRNLKVGTGIGALMLNHRGHALAQMTVVNLPDMLLLAIEDGLAAFVAGELETHIIFDQVELQEADGRWTQLTVQGREAGEVADTVSRQRQAFTVPRLRSVEGGVDVFVPGDAQEVLDALAALGSRMATPQELELLRIEAGVPAAALDAGPGVLPQEAGLEHLVSYRKGCYLGQEIMARIEARGNLRRSLAQVRLAAAPTLQDRDIQLGGRKVGQLGSAVLSPAGEWLALAVLRNDLPEGSELELAGTTGVKV